MAWTLVCIGDEARKTERRGLICKDYGKALGVTAAFHAALADG